MNEILSKFLLAEEKFMSEIHLRWPGFTYSAYGPFTKNKEGIQKIKETGVSRYIYQDELNKAYFQRDMGYGDFKYLEEQLLIRYYMMKHLILLKVKNRMDINMELLQWFIFFLIKRPLTQREIQKP